MLELQHPQEPESLAQYRAEHPAYSREAWNDFHRHAQPVYYEVKNALVAMQRGLCVYCEKSLDAEATQVEHIKPRHTHPEKTFVFANLAACCTGGKPPHCGDSKKRQVLPIEPYTGCSANFKLITESGKLVPATPEKRAEVNTTLTILNLNTPALSKARKDRFRELEAACDEIWERYQSEKMMGEYIRSEYEKGEFPSCVRQVFARFFE